MGIAQPRERDYTIDGLLGLAHARALLRNGMVHLLPSYLLVNERALFKTTTKKKGEKERRRRTECDNSRRSYSVRP